MGSMGSLERLCSACCFPLGSGTLSAITSQDTPTDDSDAVMHLVYSVVRQAGMKWHEVHQEKEGVAWIGCTHGSGHRLRWNRPHRLFPRISLPRQASKDSGRASAGFLPSAGPPAALAEGVRGASGMRLACDWHATGRATSEGRRDRGDCGPRTISPTRRYSLFLPFPAFSCLFLPFPAFSCRPPLPLRSRRLRALALEACGGGGGTEKPPPVAPYPCTAAG
jgi:hypothetical protein